jgi:hypothetical protein
MRPKGVQSVSPAEANSPTQLTSDDYHNLKETIRTKFDDCENVVFYPDEFASVRHSLRITSDQQLLSLWSELKPHVSGDFPMELCLLEMVRRGGSWTSLLRNELNNRWHMAEQLRSQIDKATPYDIQNYSKLYRRWEKLVKVIEIMTCLRRMEGAPDPIRVTAKAQSSVAKQGTLPDIDIVVENIDREKKPFLFLSSGPQYNGLHLNITVEVKDARGRTVPRRAVFDKEMIFYGGIETWTYLEYRKSFLVSVPTASYVMPTGPGIYTIQVVVSNADCIHFLHSFDMVIVFRSNPISVTVSK